MYARVTIDPIQPGKIGQAIKVERDSILRAARVEKGFKGLYFLTSRETGKGMTISLWNTESDMKAAESSGYYGEQLAKLLPLVSGPPVRDYYEVSIHEVNIEG
jgi:heme-degrading monooxygenase HmoA